MSNKKALKNLINLGFCPFRVTGRRVRIFIFASIFALVSFISLMAGISGATDAAAQGETLVGVFSASWIDPLPGSGATARNEFFLIDDQGQTLKLMIDPKQLEAAGGITALNGRRVEVRGVIEKSDNLTTHLTVTSITPSKESKLSESESLTPRLGNLKYVNILCRFSDIPDTPQTQSYFNQILGSSYPGLDHYWREVSYNQMNIQGSTAVGWYDLPHPYSYYFDSGYFNNTRFGNDCAQVADADVYFPDYYGINFFMNNNFSGIYAGVGTPYFNLSLDNVTRFYGATWMGPSGYGQSVIAHEMGHSLGLPHSSGGHATDYDSQWDVMSWPYTSVFDPVYRHIGQHTISHHKDMLGWIPEKRQFIAPPSGANSITLTRLQTMATGRNYLMAKIPLPNTIGYYYTVEVRDLVGYDQGVPAKAVVIHKLAGSQAVVVDGDGNNSPNDAGAQWTVGETFYDPDNRIAVTVNYEALGIFGVTVEANYGCTFSLSPNSQSLPAAGGNGSFQVVTDPGCSWTLSGADTMMGFQGEGFDINDAPSTPPYIGLAEVYPSIAEVSNVSGTVTKVRVRLSKMEHGTPGDIDMVLVAPGGQAVMLMSDVGESYDLDGAEFTFDQAAENEMLVFRPNPSGTYLPTNFGLADTFPAPGPGTATFGTNLDAFNGINPNGDWKLFVVDDNPGDSGILTRGWNLELATGAMTTDVTSGVGPTTVNYSVTRNYGAARTIVLNVAGQTFTVTQAGAP